MNCKPEQTVLHMIDTTGPGGAETVFIQLADLLRQEGYRSLVIIRGPGWVKNELERRGLEPIILDVKGSFALGFLYKLYRISKSEDVDVIQSHLLGSNVYAALLGVITRRPVVATYHGMVDVNPNERFRLLKNRVMRWGITQYVAVSRSLARTIRDQKLLDPSKTQIIYNGVDAKNYERDYPSTLRRTLGLPEDALLVGSLGNVRPAKAYDILVEAAAELTQRHRELNFVVAGHKKPSLMESLTTQMTELGVGGRIHFIDFVESSASFLAQLDFFVLSSRSEGFSIATVEAMMAGLPVLVTRCGGPEEIVTHGENGWVVDSEDAKALATGLDHLLANREFASRLAVAGRRHARSKFGTEAMIAGYLKIYRTLAEDAARRSIALE